MNDKKVVELLKDLSLEYERMTASGQQTLDELWKLFKLPTWKEAEELSNESV